MFGEASTLQQPPWPLERNKREVVIERLICRLSKLFDRENRGHIESIVRAEENNAFLRSTSYSQYRQLLLELSKQAERASNKSFENNSYESIEHQKKSVERTSETMSGNLATNKRDRNDKLLHSQSRQYQKRWKLETGNLMLSPLHYDNSVESSGVISTASSDCCSVASSKNEERCKLGMESKSDPTKSEVLNTSKRVLPSNPSPEIANSLEETFIALKNKYKIPFRFLKGVVPIIEDDKVCPNELKRRIQQLSEFLDLEKEQLFELKTKPEFLVKLDSTMETILHMFRPLLKEVVQWVETFGRSMFQAEPTHLSNHLSFSSEERSSNNVPDVLQMNLSKQQSSSTSEKKQTRLNLLEKSSCDSLIDTKKRSDSCKVENEGNYLSNGLNRENPPWNYQLQTAAMTTMDYVKRFTNYISQSNALKEEKMRRHVEILKNMKDAWHNAYKEAPHDDIFENLKFTCLSVERKYPHLYHELCCDTVIYIICKAKCTVIQLPILFLFPNIESDGNVFFVIQSEACGDSDFGQSLKKHFYEQVSTELVLNRNVSSILKIWGNITKSFIEVVLKDAPK
ncbi:hypothetical protein GpartN1_g4987.t1 [Galdieria partita]|uniref:Uncharacterized protein n=1 Tax=Galdieria partita TaxID=83374 RepID=A0A9C7URT0_9RHOD|nr:hypothetical protein GpartN1_g2597.t1 [Galdieria partita]GJQ13196.1 hypothetical protein GpartN1_g4987.t1 [Galdieria partita]